MQNEALPLLFSVGFLRMSFGGVGEEYPHGGTPLIVSKVFSPGHEAGWPSIDAHLLGSQDRCGGQKQVQVSSSMTSHVSLTSRLASLLASQELRFLTRKSGGSVTVLEVS